MKTEIPGALKALSDLRHSDAVRRVFQGLAGALAVTLIACLMSGRAYAAWQWQEIGATGGPGPRLYAVVVWTGHELLVWGGLPFGINQTWSNDGWRYDPATEVWHPMSTVNAPSARKFPVAVWAGSDLMIWGGHGLSPQPSSLRTGACYQPATDTWQTVTQTGAPTARGDHTMVWTGSRVIVWGGYNFGTSQYLATGGCYDPGSDSWSPISTINNPTPRSKHSAVWTGSHMIVWGGGYLGNDIKFRHWSSFGRYDPSTDIWSTGATDGAPDPRSDHSAVWTGECMIIWGGWKGAIFEQNRLRTGAAYDPDAGNWSSLPIDGAPDARASHATAWSGREMIIWGGSVVGSKQSGGRFDPSSQSWSAMPVDNGPVGGYRGAAAWSGEGFHVLHDRLARSYETGPYSLDGIPDDWQYAHFGSQQAIGAADQDPDADGQDNLMEFLAKTDPADPNSRLVLSLVRPPSGGELEFESHPVWPDRRYTMEQSNLSPPVEWLPVDGNWTDLGNQRYSIRVIRPTASRKFYRLTVELE